MDFFHLQHNIYNENACREKMINTTLYVYVPALPAFPDPTANPIYLYILSSHPCDQPNSKEYKDTGAMFK